MCVVVTGRKVGKVLKQLGFQVQAVSINRLNQQCAAGGAILFISTAVQVAGGPSHTLYWPSDLLLWMGLTFISVKVVQYQYKITSQIYH